MFVLKQNLMQGWHYLKELIYYRPIFRLTILAFLGARAINTKRKYLLSLFCLFFACGIDQGTSREKLLPYIHLKISVLITYDDKFVVVSSEYRHPCAIHNLCPMPRPMTSLPSHLICVN